MTQDEITSNRPSTGSDVEISCGLEVVYLTDPVEKQEALLTRWRAGDQVSYETAFVTTCLYRDSYKSETGLTRPYKCRVCGRWHKRYEKETGHRY